ncbi:DMT family transporter [Sedimentibacter sp.]|uniref:DMT family transporter n=1 Tax=Sedimentibacter sp. TaxID=1960295 RepID=UPI00289CBC78|nr:DMT family transporter [Sedimentibacter sp.]
MTILIRKVQDMERTPSKYIVLAGTFFTSLSSIIIRFSEAPALVISSYRMLFTCIMLLPLVIKNRDEFAELNRKNLILCIISGIFLAFHYATWISSIKLTTIANSTILVSCSPIFVALANYFIIKEKLSKKMIVSIIVSLAGTIIIALESTDASAGNMMLGNILAFLGAVFVAGYLVIGGIVRKSLGAGAYVFVVYAASAVALFIMCAFSGTTIYPYPPREFMLFTALALFCSILGHTLYNYMVKYVSSTLISVSTLSEPIFASLMALLIFKEIPSIYTLSGGIIIISGILTYLITQNNERLKVNN